MRALSGFGGFVLGGGGGSGAVSPQYTPMSQPYELGADVVAPVLPGRAVVRPSVDEAVAAAASDVFLQAQACVRAFGEFHLAMGYGPDEHRVVVRLMTDPNYRDLPWSRTHLWSVMEERVDPADPRHSHSALRDLLLGVSDMPEEQMHPLMGHLHDAEARYEARLRERLGVREAGHDRLDCVLLGAVTAGVAGLGGLVDPLDRLVGSSEDGVWVGMTGRLIRGSRLVGVLATGETGGAVVRGVVGGRVGLVPQAGELRWYLDHRACGSENLENPA